MDIMQILKDKVKASPSPYDDVVVGIIERFFTPELQMELKQAMAAWIKPRMSAGEYSIICALLGVPAV